MVGAQRCPAITVCPAGELPSSSAQLPGARQASEYGRVHSELNSPGMCSQRGPREVCMLGRKWLYHGSQNPTWIWGTLREEGPMDREKVGGVHVIHRQKDTCAGNLCARSCSDRSVTSKEDVRFMIWEVEQFQEIMWFGLHILPHEKGKPWPSRE